MWEPISDLPVGWKSLVSDELAGLGVVWREQGDRVRHTDAYVRYIGRAQREWAIETGIIEGLYTLDRGVTEILIERGIAENLIPSNATNLPVETVISLIEDQRGVIKGLFDYVRSSRELTTSYVKEIHAALTRSQQFVTGIDLLGRRSAVGPANKFAANFNRRPSPTFKVSLRDEHIVH